MAEQSPRRLTARGAATRSRIAQAAAELMYHRGVNATTLDDVRAASGTSKSQLYHHFADKDALVREVVALRGREILAREQQRLERLNSFRGLQRWRDALVEVNSLQNGAYGCALGSLAGEVSDHDELARSAIAAALADWTTLLSDGMRRMQEKGRLRPEADAEKLAIGLMGALQGGYLLANAQHDVAPMKIALDMALEHIRSFVIT
jgi:AcrR family transcriptional regulator